MGKSKANKHKRNSKNKTSYQQLDEDDTETSSQQQQNLGKKKKSNSNQNRKINHKHTNGGSSKSKKSKQDKKDDYSFRQKVENNGEREIIEMSADGNCLFRSISDQIHDDYGQRHDFVRNEICDFLEANEDDFKVYLLLEDSSEHDDVCDFDEYVGQMRKDGEWGGDVEIVCAARLYKRAITIFSNVGAYNIDVDSDDNDMRYPNILLSYHDNMHYNSVHDLNDDGCSNTVNTKRSSIQSNSTSEAQVNRKTEKKKGKKNQGIVMDDSKNIATNNSSQNNYKVGGHNHCTNERKINGAGGKNKKRHKEINDQKSNNYEISLPSQNQNVPRRNETCPCGSGLRYKKCCLAKEKSRIRLEKFREKHGLEFEKNGDNGGCIDSTRVEIEGGFAVLNI